jgi:hypothetical protein
MAYAATVADGPVQRLIADACLSATAARRAAHDLAALLDEYDVAPHDREAILAGRARLGLYRTLVRNNLFGVVAKMLERTRAALDRHAPGLFEATFEAFTEEVGPRTRYLRDVPHELLAFAAPRWRADARAPWAADLATFELATFAVAAEPPAERTREPRDLSVDAPVLFSPAVRRVRAEHAVHRAFEEEPDARPAAVPTELLVYRDEAHEPRVLELVPLAAAVTDELLRGAPLGAAIAAACASRGQAMDADALATVARLLADYGARGVVLGSGAPGD